MSANHALGMKKVKRPRDAPKMNRPWSLAERRTVLEYLPNHLRLPVAIALYTGIREGDLLRLPRNIIAGGSIKITTRNRRIDIDIDVLPGLHEALRIAPPHNAITLCANSRGKPWTESGFRASFRKQLKLLEDRGLIAPGLTFHGLRHTVAVVLAEAGISTEDIAALLGQRSSQMAEHYAREADRSRRSKAAIKKFKPLDSDA